MMGSEKPASRRRYSREYKLQVLAECDGPDASVAKVAMAHGINANIVHRWRLVDRRAQSPTPMVSNQFVPVQMTDAPALPSAPDIQIQLHRGPTAVTITWPVAAAADCATWLRELLR
jgi:transposase